MLHCCKHSRSDWSTALNNLIQVKGVPASMAEELDLHDLKKFFPTQTILAFTDSSLAGLLGSALGC